MANAVCGSLNGSLVKIEGPEENQFLKNSGVSEFWTAGINNNGTWCWEEAPFSLAYTDWNIDQMDDLQGGKCLLFLKSYGLHQWSSIGDAMFVSF